MPDATGSSAATMPSKFDTRVSAIYDAYASAMAEDARNAKDGGLAWSAVRRRLDDLHNRIEQEFNRG